jgi:hypothetical protein
MKINAKTLAQASMLAAAEFVLLLISSLIPSGRLALAAIAGTVNFITFLECGKRAALLVYTAVSVLGILLLPLKAPAVLYAAFFGYYPLLKSVIERLGKIKLEWLIKLLCALASLTLMLLVYKAGFMSGIGLPGYALWITYAVFVPAFMIYDLLLSRLIEVYIKRKIRK